MTAAKILFAGTPDFALSLVEALHAGGIVPAAVLTQPDRPSGRGRNVAQSPVKTFALANGIDVWQPETLKDAAIVERLRAARPDLMIVAAYGLILPQAVLDIPVRGCVNVHASLLPRWRGAAPIQAAILDGDEQTGISLMQMEAGLDSGPVLASAEIPIAEEDTAGTLHDRLARLGGELLLQHIDAILDGALDGQAQDESLATYAGKLRTADAALDWQQPAVRNLRKVRAYNPVPGAWFELDGERLKCWRAGIATNGNGRPGTVVAAGKDGIDVACGEGVLRLLELQRPGRRKVTGAEFAGQARLADKRLG